MNTEESELLYKEIKSLRIENQLYKNENWTMALGYKKQSDQLNEYANIAVQMDKKLDEAKELMTAVQKDKHTWECEEECDELCLKMQKWLGEKK